MQFFFTPPGILKNATFIQNRRFTKTEVVRKELLVCRKIFENNYLPTLDLYFEYKYPSLFCDKIPILGYFS